MKRRINCVLIIIACIVCSCAKDTNEIKVYSIDNITEVWNLQKNEYAILYNYDNHSSQKRFDAISLYLKDKLKYDTIQKYKEGYTIFFYKKGGGLDKDYKESNIRYLSNHIEDYNAFFLFRITFYVKNGNIIIASDMLYTVPNDIIYKNIIEFPFDLDNKFIINKEDRIWKNLN